MTMILCFNYMLYRNLSFTKHFYTIPICFAKENLDYFNYPQ